MKHAQLIAFATLCFTFSAFGQAPAGLSVKSATSSEVQLTWNGPAAIYTVQRAAVGSAFINIATVSATSYTDNLIDPYIDYTYQVVAGSPALMSNSVTVGPPPAGLSVAAPAPLFGSKPGYGYGYNISFALDGNGDPAFAFVWEDPNDNADYTQAQLLFRSWNRAQAAWNPVVKIAKTGDIATDSAASTALAFDASTKTFAIATEDSTDSINVYASTDGGATWTLRKSLHPDFSARPALAMASGKFYLAFQVSGQGLEFVTGQISSDPSTWKTQFAPQVKGYDLSVTSYSPSIALDSAGSPAIAYYATSTSGNRYNALFYWKPLGGAAPSIALTTKDSTGETDQVRLVFHNLNPRLAAGASTALTSSTPEGAGVYFLRSDDGGATWQAPVGLPPDNNSGTAYPFDIATGSKDQGAVAFGTDGVIGAMKCGNPKIALSSDLVNWSTCSPPNAENFTLYPSSLQLAFGGNDKLYLVWFNEGNTSQADTGVLMYREPPDNQPSGPVISAVQDAESSRTTVVPGSWVAIYGANLAATTRTWNTEDFTSDSLPTNLSGVTVTFNGLPAAVYFVSPAQIDVQVPSNLAGNVTVVVSSGNVASAAFSVGVVANAPSLFMYPAGDTLYPAAVMLDGTLVGDPAISGLHSTKVKSGDMVVFFVNGLAASPSGKIINSPIAYAGAVSVKIGSATVTPAYTGLVAAGEYQMNVVIPAGMVAGVYPIVVTAGGQSSPAIVMLPVMQ